MVPETLNSTNKHYNHSFKYSKEYKFYLITKISLKFRILDHFKYSDNSTINTPRVHKELLFYHSFTTIPSATNSKKGGTNDDECLANSRREIGDTHLSKLNPGCRQLEVLTNVYPRDSR